MWEPYKKGYKAWLQLEKSLSDNSVEAYLRDIDKLTQFLETTHTLKTPAEIALNDLNWIGPEFSGARAVQVRVRSSQTLRPATVEFAGKDTVVRFAEPEIGVSPGQACVIYDGVTGSRVLGGGFIRRG